MKAMFKTYVLIALCMALIWSTVTAFIQPILVPCVASFSFVGTLFVFALARAAGKEVYE
jgi:hypothetical protein